jgi:hypothetical protein
MPRETYWLKFEPTDSLYRHLIRTAVLEAQVAYLVLPDGTVAPSVENALQKLRVDEIGRKTVREWPGTTLLGRDAATLIEYRCTRTLATVLTSLTNSLYKWLEPDLPEDLGFIRSDGSVWLASTSHEKCAFLEFSSEELSSLTRREPDLARILRPEDAPTESLP